MSKKLAPAAALAGTVAGLVSVVTAAPAHAAPEDTVPPTVTVTVDPVDGSNGWHLTPAVVRLVASDRSGIDESASSLTLAGAQIGTTAVGIGAVEVTVSNDGRTTVSWSVSDTEGNTRTGSTAVAVDTTGPTAVVAATRSVVRQWDYLPVQASCGDAGSGLASCTLEGARIADTLDTSFPGEVVVSAVAVDHAGHRTTTPRTFTVVPVDARPTVAITTATPMNAAGWSTALPTVVVEAAPGHRSAPVTSVARRVGEGSTVTTAGDRETFQLTDQGTVRVAATATDSLDGVAPEVVRTFKIDTVAPKAWFSGSPTSLEKGAVVPFSLDCHDATSGLAECGVVEGLTPAGTLVTDTLGVHTVRGRAVDAAGNRTELELTYEVVAPEAPAASSIDVVAPRTTSSRATVPVTLRLGEGGLSGGVVVVTDGGTELGRYDVPAVVRRSARPAYAELAVSLPRLRPGAHRLVATYLGTDRVAPSSTKVVVTALSPARVRAAYRAAGRKVVATVTVAGLDAKAVGKVVVRDGATVVGTGVLRNGTVVVTSKSLTPGVHRLRATYAGSATVAKAATKPKPVRIR